MLVVLINVIWNLVPIFIGETEGISLTVKHNGNGSETQFNYNNTDGTKNTYWLGYDPWTSGTNSDTTVRNEAVEWVLAFAFKEVTDRENETKFCTYMTYAGPWIAILCIQRWDVTKFYGQSSWEIPC